SDEEWDVLSGLLPRTGTGRPRRDDRVVLNGIVWKLRTLVRQAQKTPPPGIAPCGRSAGTLELGDAHFRPAADTFTPPSAADPGLTTAWLTGPDQSLVARDRQSTNLPLLPKTTPPWAYRPNALIGRRSREARAQALRRPGRHARPQDRTWTVSCEAHSPGWSWGGVRGVGLFPTACGRSPGR
ncbi:transposase, partial [Streptomyces sp. NPDC005133]